jgi:hypothetical protein
MYMSIFHLTARVGGVMVSIDAFQALDPGSIPGHRNSFSFFFYRSTALKNLQLLPVVTCPVLHFINASALRTTKVLFAKLRIASVVTTASALIVRRKDASVAVLLDGLVPTVMVRKYE